MSESKTNAAGYFDGTSNRRRAVALRFGAALDIVENGDVVATWPYDSIRRVEGPPGRLRLRSTAAAPLARLDLEDAAAIATLTTRCTALDRDRGGPSQTLRIVFWSVAAVCSIVLVVIYGIPYAADRLAPLIPYALERQMGEAVAARVRAVFGGKDCDAGPGQAALDKLVEQLRVAGAMRRPLQARVLPSGTANALALPGGTVFVLNGLLQRAQTPDELAGVLAHEFGHVHHYHNMRALIRSGGTSFLVGLLLGDVTGGSAVILATRTLLDAAHSREAEQEADLFAATTMSRLGRSPVPMAQFLLRITGKERDRTRGFTILNSHPLTEDRLAAMQKQDRPVSGPELLTAEEWDALRAICGRK